MSLYDAYVRHDQRTIRAAEVVVDSLEPINWRKVIDGLMAAGVSIRSIAHIIGVAWPTVKGWYDGSVPNYEAGRKLLAMAATVERIPVPGKPDRMV